jgi:hypothetical protein
LSLVFSIPLQQLSLGCLDFLCGLLDSVPTFNFQTTQNPLAVSGFGS